MYNFSWFKSQCNYYWQSYIKNYTGSSKTTFKIAYTYQHNTPPQLEQWYCKFNHLTITVKLHKKRNSQSLIYLFNISGCPGQLAHTLGYQSSCPLGDPFKAGAKPRMDWPHKIDRFRTRNLKGSKTLSPTLTTRPTFWGWSLVAYKLQACNCPSTQLSLPKPFPITCATHAPVVMKAHAVQIKFLLSKT